MRIIRKAKDSIKRKVDDIIDRHLIRCFLNCGNSPLIDFAIDQARLNRIERETLRLLIDECRTQEEAAEIMDISTRKLQTYWSQATDKLLRMDWVTAYAKTLSKR